MLKRRMKTDLELLRKNKEIVEVLWEHLYKVFRPTVSIQVKDDSAARSCGQQEVINYIYFTVLAEPEEKQKQQEYTNE